MLTFCQKLENKIAKAQNGFKRCFFLQKHLLFWKGMACLRKYCRADNIWKPLMNVSDTGRRLEGKYLHF